MQDQNQLSLNELATSALRTSAGWSLFLSIVGFIYIAFLLIVGISSFAMMSSIPDDPYGSAMMMNPFFAYTKYLGIVYILGALLYFFPVYYLFNYATGTKRALESGNNDVLANALVNLKSHHKFLGIFTIVVIAMCILIFIGVMAFAASYAGSMH